MRTLLLFIILLISVSLTIGIGHSGARESMQVKEEIELKIGYLQFTKVVYQ